MDRGSFSRWAAGLLLLLMSALFGAAADEDRTLYVHIIPHSHCDPGWLDTFEQYYRRDVSRILHGVMNALARDSSKRFVWSELSFFMRWWQTLNPQDKQKFKSLVSNGQLEFVGGGWVQNDEANPTAEAVVNQVSEGHDYIESLFGVRPHIGWQIDPFGHSAMTPSLWALMGYDAMVINRIHYQTKKRFKNQGAMEFVWQGSRMSRQADLDTSIFTHVLHSHYSAPRGYDWEEPGVPRVSTWNAGSRAASLVSKLKRRASAYKTRHLLVTFGDDFKFKNAALQFQNMDLIIKNINSNQGLGVHIRYSTLSEYFQAVHSDAHRKNVAFPFHRGDFFPYADNGDSYWTGYYSTRPNLKQMSRMADANLRAAEAVYAFSRARFGSTLKMLPSGKTWDDSFKKIEELRLNAALTLHHDAITGTSRTTVVRDYKQRLVTSSNSVKGIAAEMVDMLLQHDTTDTSSEGKFKITGTSYTLPLNKLPPVADGQSPDASSFPVIVQNPLGWRRQDVVSVGLSANLDVCRELQVVDDAGRPVRAQVAATLDPQDCHTNSPTLNMRLFIEIDVPAMGLRTYFVRRASRKDVLEKNNLAEFTQTQIIVISRNMGHVTEEKIGNVAKAGMLRGGANGGNVQDAVRRLSAWPTDKSFVGAAPSLDPEANRDGTRIELKTGRIGVMFQKWSGSIESITNRQCCRENQGQTGQGATRKVQQKWMRYSSTRSGAYLFRPHGPAVADTGESETVTIAVIKGNLLQQVRYYASHVQQTTSLYNIVGPLGGVVHFHPSTTADMNTEVVLRFSTDVATGGTFFTDNGAELIERTYDSSKPIPANFYPMNAGMALREVVQGNKRKPKQVMVLNDHPMACASLSHTATKSDMEFMVQRSLRSDDGRGLAQGVHDSSRGGGPMFLLLDESDKVSGSYRMLSQLLHNRAQIFLAEPKPISKVEWLKDKAGFFAPLGGQLPPSLHVFTLKVKNEGKDGQGDVLLRLQNFANENYHIPAQAASLASAGLFLSFSVDDVRERTLSAVAPAGEAQSKRLHYPASNRDDDDAVLGKVIDGGDGAAEGSDGDANQNTDEEGVFISAAALAKLEEDKRNGKAGRRRLLAEGRSGVGYVFEVPAFQLRTYFLCLKPRTRGGSSSLPMPQSGLKQVKEGGVVSAPAKPIEVPNVAKTVEEAKRISDPLAAASKKESPDAAGKEILAQQKLKQVAAVANAANVGGVGRGKTEAVNSASSPVQQTHDENTKLHSNAEGSKLTERPTSVSVDGSTVPIRIRDAHAWMKGRHTHSLVSIELGFVGGTLFGVSLMIMAMLCWSFCRKGSSESRPKSRRKREPRRDTGTPFRKSH